MPQHPVLMKMVKPPSSGDTINIHEDGLVCYVDAGIASSYGGSGTTWTDISTESNDHTWDTAPSHTSGSAGYFEVTGAEDTTGGTTNFSTGASAWTYEMWFRPDVVDNWQGLFSVGTNSADDGFVVGINPTGNVYVEKPGDDTITSSSTLTATTWYSVCLTYNGTTVELFINNTSEGTDAQTLTITFGTCELANAFIFGDSFDGRLAAFIAYNDELTSTERGTNYTEFTSRY